MIVESMERSRPRHRRALPALARTPVGLVGAVQQPEQVAGIMGSAGEFGVHAGGTHTGGGLVGSFGVWKLQRPARLLHR